MSEVLPVLPSSANLETGGALKYTAFRSVALQACGGGSNTGHHKTTFMDPPLIRIKLQKRLQILALVNAPVEMGIINPETPSSRKPVNNGEPSLCPRRCVGAGKCSDK